MLRNFSINIFAGTSFYFDFPGIGLHWQQNYNKNGLVASVNYGLPWDGYKFISSAGIISLSYQSRIGNSRSFISLGGCVIVPIDSGFYDEYIKIIPIPIEFKTDWGAIFLNPIISIDVRL